MTEGSAHTRIILTSQQWQHVERTDDLTCYWPCTAISIEPESGKLPFFIQEEVEKKWTFDGQVELYPPSDFRSARSTYVRARANVVKCNAKASYSGTFRVTHRAKKKGEDSNTEVVVNAWPQTKSKYLIPAEFQADFLFDQLFPEKDGKREEPQGAVVIAGTTGCGKSVFGRAFALRVIRHHLNHATRMIPTTGNASARFPHLVTYEDPIEGWGINVGRSKLDLTDPSVCQDLRILADLSSKA